MGFTDPDYVRWRDLVRERTGLEFPAPRRGDLERAVLEGVRTAGVADIDAFYRLLSDRRGGAAALEAWVPALTIGETHFFRNRPQMQALEQHILPEIIKRRRDTRRLRIWSAACSSGEEPYTLAMLVDRVLPDRASWDVSILGTDIDRDVLTKARRGLYGAWSFREVPAGVKETYFTPSGPRFQVSAEMKRLVTFSLLNLIEGDYPSRATKTCDLDLILCRNVLIYFNEETIRRVLGRLHDALVPGGWLVPGHAEPSLELFNQFATTNFPGTVVYRRRDQGTAVPGPVASARPRAVVPAPAARASAAPRPERTAMRPAFDARPQPSAPVGVRGAATRANPFERRPAANPAVAPRASARRLDVGAPAPSSTVPAGAPASSEDADRAYEEGVALIARGQSAVAFPRLEAASLAAPADARLHLLLAKIHASRLELHRAEERVDLALAHASLSVPAHYLRGLILSEQGRIDDALEAQRRVVYAEPDFVLGQYALAGLFSQLGQVDRARKALQNAARLLAGRPADELVPEGDGLTVGRLAELVSAQERLAA